jgi:hypothetical protein
MNSRINFKFQIESSIVNDSGFSSNKSTAVQVLQ